MQGRKARKKKERRKERNKERKKKERKKRYTKSAQKYSFFSNTLIFSMGCLELYYLK